MLIAGSLYADFFGRSGAPASRQDAGSAPTARGMASEAATATSKPAANAEDRSSRFSMISTISPGSLAAAYHVMRSREDAPESAAAPQPQERAILSGLGIPSALNAYNDVLESD